MQQLRTAVPAFILLSLIVSPLSALADATTTPSTYAVPMDGASQSGAERQQNVRGWRHRSTETDQKISALGAKTSEVVPMPVLFGVGLSNISPNFGDPRSDNRTHEGEDIMATKGTPIVSPTPAVVLRTGSGPSEGNFVSTANPGGETFVYMHLDKIGEGVAEGTVLETGSLIGYVGNTGNASGGAAHLHFEIHDSNSLPTNPFPRLTAEFSVAQKIAFLTKIMAQTSDANALAQFLVLNFRSTFAAAASQGLAVPQAIAAALALLPDTSTAVSAGLPPGDLASGSAGANVASLQQYLIDRAIGPAAAKLKEAGATGTFGPITQAALIEFQAASGISPANGYYGAASRLAVSNSPVTRTPAVSNPAATTPASGTPFILSRSLTVGMSGDDVKALQKFLNKNGFTVTTSGPGSLGNETSLFGGATKAAVIRFQAAKGISPASGFVGPLTRAVLATMSI